jgi:hypothetical protein
MYMYIFTYSKILYKHTVLLDKNKIKEGDDLVVMVINEGEIDLYLNFACSCRLHNISMSKVLVFVGSRYIYLYIYLYMYTIVYELVRMK